MSPYTLGLFSNMYPPGPPRNPGSVILTDTTRGIFVKRMVDDLEREGIIVKKAVKRTGAVTGYAAFCCESVALARDKSLDIIQAEYIPHSSIIPVLFKRKSCPIVLKFHGDDARIFPFQNPLCMSMTRSMIRRSDYILTASEDIRTILITLGALPDRTTALHSGVDTSFFARMSRDVARQKFGLSPDATIFLFIGRLVEWKGLNEIVSVARLCPESLFVFIGPGTVPPHTENCRFAGSLQPESVRDWYNAADCLLLPTYTDAVPTSVMEAFSCELPAVVTNIGGCPEIVEHGKNGLIIPVRDVAALHDAVVWMREHPDERRAMGEMGRVTVMERYDHRTSVKKLIGIHEMLIAP